MFTTGDKVLHVMKEEEIGITELSREVVITLVDKVYGGYP